MSPRERKQRDFILKSREGFQPVKREEIYGAEHLLRQADEVVDILKNFRAYRDAGVSFGSGALFLGSSGTGKTLLARYVATASGAKFVNFRKFPIPLASGSSFHLWLPQDITAAFKYGEKYAAPNNCPIVFFIDQFDDWLAAHKNVVDQLEIELDGFSGKKEGIYLIATAKDKPKGSNLFRGKRIDKTVTFGSADRKQRTAILNGFIGRYPHKNNIAVKNLACMLVDASPAAMLSGVDEAYQLCVRRVRLAEVKTAITKAKGHVVKPKTIRGTTDSAIKLDNDALIEVFLLRATEPDTGHVFSAEEEKKVAIHELGHYVVARALGLPVQFFTVKPTEKDLGETFVSEGGAIKSLEVEEVKRSIASCLGSVKIEQFFGLPPLEGSVGDMENATTFARELAHLTCRLRSAPLREYGLMAVDIGNEDYTPQVSDHLLEKLEREIGLVLRAEERRCEKILKFFGMATLTRVLDAFIAKPNKVMLQCEIDPLLEPKLSEFHKRHKIKDLILEENW